MCGITGLYLTENGHLIDIKETIEEMNLQQRRRGPDGEGSWADIRVGLGAVRLHITGGKEMGKQPLIDRWGNIIVFNGEIYDRKKVLEDLGETFNAEDSDGIVLSSIIQKKGVEGLNGLSGMFACAIYNPKSGKLLLVRDTLGKKPLYFLKQNKAFYFASTVSALKVVAPELNARHDAIIEYLIYRSIGGYKSAFEGINQLPPGSWMEISQDNEVRSGRWWKPVKPTITSISPEVIRLELEKSILKRAEYSGQLGIFLSGGLDSSVVAAVVLKKLKEKTTLLSIGYSQTCVEDETKYSKEFANYTGGKHVILEFNTKDVPQLMRETAALTEDPIQDPVLVTTLALSKYASSFTKVVLTGDGSDELWGGYERFDNFSGTVREYLPRTAIFHPAELGLENYPESYLEAIDASDSCQESLDNVYRLEIANRMRNFHLARIDKIAMGCGLEIRAPFVDNNVINLALSLTSSCKRPNGEPKGLLKNAFAPVLPDWLVARKKQPFTLPLASWFSTELYEFANDTLGGNCYVKNFINPQPYLENLKIKSIDANGNAKKIWSLLQLEMWNEQMLKNDKSNKQILTKN